MFQIAHIESKKSKEIEETVEFLSLTVTRIRLVKEFPTDIAHAQLENVECAALNFLSAVMEYIATSIQHLKKGLAR